MWDFSDPAATETRMREALALAEERGDRDYQTQILTQIARTKGLRRLFDESHAILDTVEPMLRGSDSALRGGMEAPGEPGVDQSRRA